MKPQTTSKQSTNIFISYRREETAGHTGRLYDRLSAHFSDDQIFMDVDHIEPGEDFVQVLEDAVGSCSILLAVIGKRWLHSSDGATRRLDNPNDFVRIEIATALNRNVRVIPVLVQGATMPGPQDLPDDLAKLARRQAFELSDLRWRQDVDRLIGVLEKVLAGRRAEEQRKREQEEAEGSLRREQEEPAKREEEEALAAERAAEEQRRLRGGEAERQSAEAEAGGRKELEEGRTREAEEGRRRAQGGQARAEEEAGLRRADIPESTPALTPPEARAQELPSPEEARSQPGIEATKAPPPERSVSASRGESSGGAGAPAGGSASVRHAGGIRTVMIATVISAGCAIIYFIFVRVEALFGRTPGLIAGALATLVALFFWYVMEMMRRREREPEVKEKKEMSMKKGDDEEGGTRTTGLNGFS